MNCNISVTILNIGNVKREIKFFKFVIPKAGDFSNFAERTGPFLTDNNSNASLLGYNNGMNS